MTFAPQDDCARQVTGTANQPARTQRASDCASFLATTIVPSPSVVTMTSTFANGQPTPSFAAASSPVTTAYIIAGTFVPPYIDECGSGLIMASRYSSVCACFPGITRATITAARPTVTVTSYTAVPSFTRIGPSGRSHDRIYFSDTKRQVRLQEVIESRGFTRGQATEKGIIGRLSERSLRP